MRDTTLLSHLVALINAVFTTVPLLLLQIQKKDQLTASFKSTIYQKHCAKKNVIKSMKNRTLTRKWSKSNYTSD